MAKFDMTCMAAGVGRGNKFGIMVHVDFHVDCECFSLDGAVVVVVVVVGSVVVFLFLFAGVVFV